MSELCFVGSCDYALFLWTGVMEREVLLSAVGYGGSCQVKIPGG